jgi:hypothetical protein
MFCLISLLVLGLIGVSLREVDWSAEARREREKRANNALNGRAGTRRTKQTSGKPARRT